MGELLRWPRHIVPVARLSTSRLHSLGTDANAMESSRSEAKVRFEGKQCQNYRNAVQVAVRVPKPHRSA